MSRLRSPTSASTKRDARAALRQRRAEIGGRRRFADAALARGHDDRPPELCAAGVATFMRNWLVHRMITPP